MFLINDAAYLLTIGNLTNFMNNVAIRKIRFERSAIFLVPLILFIIGGFWRSYFSKLFAAGANPISFYTHFHFLMVAGWVSLLVIQPILIRQKKAVMHRRLGKVSYFLMPLVIVSVFLMFHSRHKPNEPFLDFAFFNLIKDVIVLAVMYGIAVRYRHKAEVHARAMIATAVPFIEPALVRLMAWHFPELGKINFIATIVFVHLVLITLIIIERKQQSGRWVFPLVWGWYLVTHPLLIAGIHIPGLTHLADWFVRMPFS